MKRKRRIEKQVIRVVIIFVLLGGFALTRLLSITVFDKWSAQLPAIDTFILTENETATLPTDWRLILVNSTHDIPPNYEVELLELSNGIYVDARIYPDLQQMFDDARAEGINPIVGEGYRTHEAQQQMMDDKVNAYMAEGYTRHKATQLAKKLVAEPGTSEHELGLALDINAGTGSDNWGVYTWLADNAYKYGFILRYPQGKTNITGIDYEPWHYRYVGKEAAKEIFERKVTLEEYLE